MFYDFEAIKERVSLSQAALLLGLQLSKSGAQMRGPCPTCNSGGPRALVITEGKGFYCFAAHKGGDQIALVAHINDVSIKDAAAWLAGGEKTVPAPVPVKAQGAEEKHLAPLSYLEHDHAAVLALGIDPEFAKRIGCGYAPRGTMRGNVLWPIRDEHGSLLGYVGVQDCIIPADFSTNVVRLKKPA